MNTQTLDKIYLEWSQLTKARTKREIEMKKIIIELYSMIENGESINEKIKHQVKQVDV